MNPSWKSIRPAHILRRSAISPQCSEWSARNHINERAAHVARNRYSGSIKPLSACTSEFLGFRVSDASLTLSQFGGPEARYQARVADSSRKLTLIASIVPVKRGRELLGRPCSLAWTITGRLSKLLTLVTPPATRLARFLLLNVNKERTYLHGSAALTGYLHSRRKGSTGSRAGYAGIPEVIGKGRTTWFSNGLCTVRIWSSSHFLFEIDVWWKSLFSMRDWINDDDTGIDAGFLVPSMGNKKRLEWYGLFRDG